VFTASWPRHPLALTRARLLKPENLSFSIIRSIPRGKELDPTIPAFVYEREVIPHGHGTKKSRVTR
jgi:hypothetical protein